MPVYKLNGEVYDIPEDVVSDFEKDNPSATIHYKAGNDDYDIPVSEKTGFLETFPDAKYADEKPKSRGLLSRMFSPIMEKANSLIESAPKPKPSNKAEDYQFTQAQLESGRSAQAAPQQVTQEEPQQPIDLSRPEEYQIPKPFKKGGEEARELAQNFNNSLWARTQAETNSDLLNPTKDNFAERMASIEMAQQVEAARRMNRGEFDEANAGRFERLYQELVPSALEEEKTKGVERARKEADFFMPCTVGGNIGRAVAYEKHTDPQKIASATIQRVQSNEAFGDYVLSRMGINTNAGNGGESEPLSEEEKKYMQLLFATESGEVADQLIRRIYDQYEAEGAPKSTLDYIAGKAFHENFAASLAKAIVRRAANSSGIREQLRAMASEEYGQNAGWMTRMIGGAAPFAVDMLTGGFAAPTAVGQAVVKGGVGMAAKEVTKEMSKRAAARGLKDAALAEAVAGGAGVAERYLATQAPILNLVLRSAGSAANFATYDVLSEAVRQLSEGEFNAGNLVKQAIHGATLGSVLGVTGGMIANATRNSGLTKKVLADIAGVGAETGIFAAANGIEKAQQLGIDITDVDWADTTGEALGMVIGMKGVGTVMHPKTFLQRYRQSKDLGMQLNQRDIDELKAAGYNFDSIFKGLGELGKMAPENATITRRAAEYTIDDSGKRDQRNTETTEAYVDEDAFNAMLSNPEISSSVKRKLTFIATGKVLSLEPVFGASLDVDENGKATITTKNAYGNPIETKEYDSQEEAEKAYQAVQEMARTNTVGGLERIADKVGFQDVKDIAKGRTMNETGTDVDNLDQLSELSSEEANKVLDTYIKNLQDAYMERFNENLKRIGEANPVTESQGTVGEGGGTPQRTERRQAAYDRGANVAAVDEGQLGTVSYEGKLAEARMMQSMPDGSQQEAIRKQIMQAVEAGDIEAAERIFTQQSPYLSSQQREAVDSYLDAYETGQGIDDFMQQSIEGYEAEQSQWLAQRSDPQGIVTPIILKDGRTVCYLSGDLNGLSAVSSIFVVTEDGENIQISKKDIAEIGQSQPASDILANDVQDYTNWLTTRYNMLADGSMLAENQEADIMIGGQMFHVVSLGQDGQGNTIVQMADGSTMPMAPDQMRDAVDAADFAKIQQLLSEEQQAIVAQQRTERFNAGIVGHAEGTPDLTAKDTKSEVAAEYLLSQTDEQGQPVERKVVLDGIQRQIDELSSAKQQALQALQTAENSLAMAEDGSEEANQADAVIKQLEPQFAELDQQRRKWGEIRQAMMTDEERQAFEKDRIKAVSGAKTQSKKDMQPVGEPAGTVVIPSKEDIVAQYPERGDGEAFVEEQRRQLSQQYRNDVYPTWDNIQKRLNDYQHGLSDLSPKEIKQLTDEQVRLETLMSQMVDQQNTWKKLTSDLGREYSKMERQQMTPHELAMNRLANETDKTKKVKLAQEAFKDDSEALAVLENMEPQDVYEFVAANLGKGSINWEGKQVGEHYVRGLRDELGKDKTRGVGSNYDTHPYNQFLAPEGQGKGIDEVVHNMAEGSPYDPQDVKNALLGMLAEATKPTDISHYIENARITEAERIYEGNRERERQAGIDFEDDAIRQTTGLEPDEYDAMMADLEQRLAEQEGFENSDDYFKYVEEYEQREIKRSAGRSQEESPVVVQGQEGQPTGAQTSATQGADAADGKLKQAITDVDALANKYPSQAPTEVLDSRDVTDDQLAEIAGQELSAEELAAGREWLREYKSPALYSPFSKKIYIFADKHGVRTEEGYFHENMHRWLESVDNAAEIFDAFWNASTSPVSMENKKSIEEQYTNQPEMIPEEYMVNVFGVNMAKGSVEKLLNRLSPEHRQTIEQFLNVIHYDTKAESAARGAEETKDLAGGTTEVVHDAEQAAEGGVRNGRAREAAREAARGSGSPEGNLSQSAEENKLQRGGVNGTPIQGLDGYTEKDVTDLVRQHFTDVAGDTGAELVDMKVIGSRVNGNADADSDLDVLLEYNGDIKEDDLFSILNDEDNKLYIEGIPVDINPITKGKSGTIAEFLERNKDYQKEDASFSARLAKAKADTDINPTEEQKKAGNYKMGHIRFGGYRMSIENPKGSTRSGKDANGNPWSIEMKDTYGYIGQKYGTDGDHLDFFINDDADLDTWTGRVYVVDQKTEDGTFDEHKVMYGYPTWSAAKKAYERNYEDDWWDKHVMSMTGMKKENFDRWLADSDHKRKPFADYARTKHAQTVSDPMEQLMADVEERKNLKPDATGVVAAYKPGELEQKSIDELKQLRKKRNADRATSRIILGTTNVQKGGLKERTLTQNIAQADADLAAIDKVLEQKQVEQKARVEQQEIGGAMVDQLENMGFDVTADTAEMRRVRKQAEQDKSEEGKLRHMRTSDGRIYGFTYKGKMYLDPRKIDANLPIHEYAHPWCEAFRRLNPEGWKHVVDVMRSDKDTWEFVKALNPDLKDDDDIAEEMIAKGSGEKGQERARAEYERMNQRDPNYKSKWGNIWKNISKAIQDFWKQVGDFLHIKYESAEQVYDQVVRDFVNKINPRKRVEQWLKERDDVYLKAVEAGDDAKAKELFDAALRENIGNGITPYIAVEGYRKMRTLAHGVKSRDPKVIAKVADMMAPIIPQDAVLVPAPSHTGKATDMLDLAQAISERTGAPVADVLTSKERPSQYEAKYAGHPISSKDMGITVDGKLPDGRIPVVIDNVVDTGNTAEACIQALGKGIVASLADSVEQRKHVASLKSAEPVVTDKKGNVVPLSERFEFMIEEGNLFSDEDFEEPTASVVQMPLLDNHGLNVNSTLGKRLAELKEQAGEHGLVGYTIDDDYTFVGDSTKAVGNMYTNEGERDGMRTVTVSKNQFDTLSSKLVKAGYKLAFLDNPAEEPTGTNALDQYVRETDEPKSAIDKVLDEVERRQEAAADKKSAEKAVKEYIESLNIQGDEVRQRATKAVLLSMNKAGVPYKVVSKEEEKQMLKLFSMMNQESIIEMARRPSMRAMRPHGRGKYIVYNMNNPFGVPIYAEKMSVAKFELESMRQLIPEGDWAILNIGYPDEARQELRTAADMNINDLQAMTGWHGSGAVFTKFDHSHMGEGAGSQVFGWGTYLSNGRGIGESYADSLSKGWSYDGKHLNDYKPILDGSPNRTSTIRDILSSLNLGHPFEEAVNQERRHIESAIRDYEEEIDDLSEADKRDLDTYKTELEFVNSLNESDFEPNVKVLYKVEIPEDTGDNYLDYKKPVGEELAKKIRDFVYDHVMNSENKGAYEGMDADVVREDIDRVLEPESNMAWMQRPLETRGVTPKEFSRWLSKQGYVGIKYPAGTIWGGGDGATNYVIFNEDDAKITDTIQFMIDNAMFQKEGKRIFGWSDGKQVYLTQAGLNPNTPIHECTHLWDKWCQQEEPELWKKVVAAMKKTKTWEDIANNPNYRHIWDDENRMANEVHSRLSGATGEEEFMKAAFKKGTSQKIIDEVKSVLRKFWERILQLFGKHSKTVGNDWDSLDAIIRMPIRDLVNQDFEKVMKVAGEDAVKRDKEYDMMRSKAKNKRIYPSKGNLNDAVDLIRSGLKKKRSGQFEIAVPDSVNRKAEKILKHSIKKHYIDIGGLNHGYNNHGENGKKLQKNSIPLTKEDMELAPYILMSPDKIVSGSENDGIGSVRYIKYLSNGNVVYIEAEGNLDGSELVSKNMWATMSPHAMTPSKVVDARSENAPKLTSNNVILSNDAAKIRKDAETAIENDKKIREEQQNRMKAAADAAAEQLGGIKVNYAAGDEIADDKLKRENEQGTLGVYDPNTGDVTLLLDNIEDVEEAVRTVCHEKLGHEGLVALLGSQAAVMKFGSFIFGSAKKGIRQRIMEKADDIDPEWKDGARYSKAAQEVFADIAADGPRTADEFDLWTKVKHYIIRLCNKIGLRIRGLLNDHDLAYYVLKTGEALKKWNTLDETERQHLSKQSDSYDIMRSRRGKPRKRNSESDAQYFQRLREWEKWRAAVKRARDNGDPEPEEQTFHEQAEAAFKADLQEWKERNGIPAADAAGVGAFPRREADETPQEYAVRVAEWETNNDMWKSAPQMMDYLTKANEAYRRAYTEWRIRYDLEEQASVDQRLYEGDVDPNPTFTDADMEAEALAEKDLAEAVGMEVDEAGAKRHAKLAVIERRKNMESSNAEDAIWVYDFMKQTDEVAKQIAERTGQKVTGKEIREALPFLIEADRRRENLEAEREDAVMAINMSDAIQQAHSFIDFYNLDNIGEELKALNNAWEHHEAEPDMQSKQAYHDTAARLADKLNSLNADMAGYNKLFADDIIQIRSLLTTAANAGRGNDMPESAKRFADMPEIQPVMEHIKDWYDEFYQVLEDAGLRGDAGYIGDGYVNHVWDKEKSDPKAWEQYIENRQRTKSPNMRHREIDTYMDGIEIGLVPKYADIADMIAHYSRQNNEAVANRRFLDDLQFVVVEEVNDAGEVTAILPLVEFDKPNSFVRERYTQYYVPGVGDIYVLKAAKRPLDTVLGSIRQQGIGEKLQKVGKLWDTVGGLAKKTELALSGFHALALFEIDLAQHPIKAWKHLFKYILFDGLRRNNNHWWGFGMTRPAYAHPEDFEFAAKHLVQLGATEDYAASDVNAITDSFRKFMLDKYSTSEGAKKMLNLTGLRVAEVLDWFNKGFDAVLWNYLHDGLKLAAFKELASQVDRKVAKNGLSEEMREKLLDEAGQYVNDLFGGQFFDIINFTPAEVKWARRMLLSPDWTISSMVRLPGSLAGLGSLYTEGSFMDYLKYWKRKVKGEKVDEDYFRDFRMRNAVLCYLAAAFIIGGLFVNLANAWRRREDEEEQRKLAEEIRKTKDPNYKSPYELKYPDGMKWYDYTLWGNASGHKTHLFTGRYEDGTERYARWGKHFREVPELFEGEHGLEFPSQFLNRIKAKQNPNISMLETIFGLQGMSGYEADYHYQDIMAKYGKNIATVTGVMRHFVPFGISLDPQKEWYPMDFFMPSSKGYRPWKAKRDLEYYLIKGDEAGCREVYNSCVMNGVDFEACLKAAIGSIKATTRKGLSDGVTNLTTATEKFDAATKPEERSLYLNKIKKYLREEAYESLSREEALEKVHSFLQGTDESEKENVRYVMLATSKDIIAEEKLKDLLRKARQFNKDLEEKHGTDEYDTLKERYGSWLKIKDIINRAYNGKHRKNDGINIDGIRDKKKLLGTTDDDEAVMNSIREIVEKALDDIEKLQAPEYKKKSSK